MNPLAASAGLLLGAGVLLAVSPWLWPRGRATRRRRRPERGLAVLLVQAGMPPAPFVERGRTARACACRGQLGVPPLVPRLRGRVDRLPGELVDDQPRGERREEIHGGVERIHVVEHAPGDGRVERSERRRQLLERRPAEALARRCVRVDADDVVARVREQLDHAALAAAADLEHARRRGREPGEDEVAEAGHPYAAASVAQSP